MVSINLIIIINFGINPVSGGTPASDSIRIAMQNTNTILFLNKLCRVLIVFELIVFIIMKIGNTIIEYIIKYTMQKVYLLIASIDVIHPMWPIDEYASRGRKWVWFIPSTPPIKAFNPAVIIINLLDWILYKVIISSDSGANFCHVDKIIQFIHDNDAITEGYQKWHGAIPNLISIATVIVHIGIICDIGWYSILIPNSISIDPKACDKKYLIDASVSWFDLVAIIIGINLSILISSIIHALNQFGLMTVMIVLINNNEYIAHINGVWLVMKDLEELNPLLMVRSL